VGAIARRGLGGAVAVALILGSLAVAAGRPGTAAAHAVLVRSSPESQAQLREAPPVIDLWFSEPLEPEFSRVELYASDGTLLELAGMRVDPADAQHLSALTSGLGPGIYTVVYRTLSTRDGHEWSGSTTFTVVNPDGSAPAGGGYAPDLDAGTTAAEVAGRWLVFTAFAVFAGGALIAMLGALEGQRTPIARRARRLAVRLGVAVLPIALGGSLLQLVARADALGTSELELLSGTRFGTILLWRGLALLAVAAALGLALLAARRRRERLEGGFASVAALAALGGLATISMLSHAAAAPGSFWAILGDALHLVLAAAWVGGLLVLAALLLGSRRGGGARLGRLVARFSLFATGALGLLAATGLLRATGEIPTADALFETEYGAWLLIKLGLLLVPLAVALRNRANLELWRQREIDEDELHDELRRTLPLEAGLALLVLGTVAVLGQVPTPRGDEVGAATARTVATDVNLIEQVDDLTVHLQISPALVGSNELRLHLYHADGSAIGTVDRVQLELAAGAATGGDIVEPVPEGDDIYRATATASALAVEWSVSVDVRRAGIDDARLAFRVPIAVDAGPEAGAGQFGSPTPQLSRNFLWALLLTPVGATLLVLGATQHRRDVAPRRRPRGAPWRWRPGRPARAGLPRPSLRAAGTAVVLAAVVLGVSGSPHSHGGQLLENPVANDPASFERGRAIYAANCASCHGVEGLGDGPLAATLTPQPANLALHVPLHPEGDTYVFIANGFPNTAMPAWSGTLSEEQIWDVVNYLRTEFAE
jgi:copper transport protein